MIFEETRISGVWRVLASPMRDERGFFVRTFCSEAFASQGLVASFEQSSLSHNLKSGTLRGMHFQAEPDAETKFVRCVRGAVFDVAVDLRPGSPTEGHWVGETLTDENALGLYIPPGVAHGFQTLTNNSDVLYQITPAFRPGFGQGVRWNDPAFGIDWPIAHPELNTRDAGYPDWRR